MADSDLEPSDGEGSEMEYLRGSDDDDDDGGFGAGAGGGSPLGSDDDDDDEQVGAPSDDEDEDEDEDEDDKEPEVKEKKQQHLSQLWGKAQQSAGGKKAAAGASSSAASSKQPKGKAAATKGAKGGRGDKPKPTKGSDDDDDDGGGDDEEDDSGGEKITREGFGRKPLKMPSAVDPIEEHDQLRKNFANGGASKGGSEDGARPTVEPKVSRHIHEHMFVLKNDKGPAAKRFYGLLAQSDYGQGSFVVHAPSYKETDDCHFTLTAEQVLHTRPHREAMLSALADDAATLEKMTKELHIYKAKADPAGSGSGPGVTNVVAFLPCRLEDTKENTDALYGKICEDVFSQPGTLGVVRSCPTFDVPIDEKLMKRLYKHDKGNLPSVYNPNKHGNVKYRVWSKLEDQEKIDGVVSHLVPPAASKAKRKRPEAAGAGRNGEAKKGKATGDSDAPGASSSSSAARDADCNGKSGEAGKFASLNWASAGFGIEIAGVQCNADETITILTVRPGRFLLVKTYAP